MRIFLFGPILVFLPTMSIAATCEPGQYVSNDTCIICPLAYYCPDGVNRYSCPNGVKGSPSATWCSTKWYPSGDHTGCSSISECVDIYVPYTSAHGSGVRHHFWNEATQAFDRANSTIILEKCDAGYYKDISTTKYPTDCSAVGIGYYSLADEIDRTACPDAKSTHTMTAASASECDDLCPAGVTELCIGDKVFPIWKNKPTTIAINIKYKNTTCYVALEEGAALNTMNLSFGGKTYYVTY